MKVLRYKKIWKWNFLVQGRLKSVAKLFAKHIEEVSSIFAWDCWQSSAIKPSWSAFFCCKIEPSIGAIKCIATQFPVETLVISYKLTTLSNIYVKLCPFFDKLCLSRKQADNLFIEVCSDSVSFWEPSVPKKSLLKSLYSLDIFINEIF